ncbi:hypothetical protein BGX27_000337 [Mortierella sp. AM989]|nr:hypothetical protein BGX27_000337 [Mortierella sp. AM989]
MKFLSPRIVAFATIVSITCLLSTPVVQAREQDTLAIPNAIDIDAKVDGSILDLHGKKNHHHHHHSQKGHHHHHSQKGHKGSKPHKKSHKKPHKKSHKKHHHKPATIKKKLNLICDSVVVDHITCTTKVTPLLAARSLDTQTSFNAFNNGGKIETVSINMDIPCSAQLPSACSAAREMALEAQDVETDGTEHTNLWFKKNKHSKHSKHSKGGHHHHKGTSHGKHHGKHHNHKNHKHPYAGLCVAVGDFCGASLYGCDFVPSTLYSCKAVGEKPHVIQTNSKSCDSSPVPTLCTCSGSGPFCGASFPSECGMDTSILYSCEASGASPMATAKCRYGCTTDTGVGSCIMTPPTDQCTCPDGKAICGAAFPSSCYLSAHALYSCNGAGAKPERGIDCNNGCNVDPIKPDSCLPGTTTPDCTCQSSKDTCGFNFPESCGLSDAGLYSCSGKGSTPSLQETCGGYCVPKDNAHSKCSSTPTPSPDCSCKDTADHCGASFPSMCDFDPNSLYSCSNVGAAPLVTQKCADYCYKDPNSRLDICSVTTPPPTPDDCTCPDGKAICGAALPSSCYLSAHALYSCRGRGAKPERGTDCNNGCNVDPIKPDSCLPGTTTPDCTCQSSKDTCGFNFPESCGLSDAGLYSCSGKGSTPSLQETCGGYCVPKDNAHSKCSSTATPASDCSCKDTDDHCGASFPSTCGFDPNSLYSCSNVGAAPLVTHKCADYCYKNPNSGLDICSDLPTQNSCECRDNHPICGSRFPPSCGFDQSSVYTCSAAGSQPTAPVACSGGCVIDLSGADSCSTTVPPVDDCACIDASTTCGSAFPTTCGLDANAIYTCPSAGATPVSKVPCADGCSHVAGANDVCTAPADPCVCVDSDAACGSKFPTSCGLAVNTLYTCSGAGSTPVAGTVCTDGCAIIPEGSDVCSDPTLPPTECSCVDGNMACGSKFPASCGLSAGSLYSCAAAGEGPVANTVCPLGCTVNTDASDACTTNTTPPTDCTCKDSGATCGSVFPTSCGYSSNTLYSCSAVAANPVAGSDCVAGCTVATGDDSCALDCTCQDSFSHCGSDFPTGCGFAIDTLYSCAVGSTPAVVSECGLGQCSANIVASASISSGSDFKKAAVEDDFCVDPCACQEANTLVCGSTFPTQCNHNSTVLLSCAAAGDVPSAYQTCTVSCDVLDGSDECALDPCLCTGTNKVCGTNFPTSCNYSNSSLYTCSAVGVAPTSPVTCDAGCEPTLPENSCNATSSCSAIATQLVGHVLDVVQSLNGVAGNAAVGDEFTGLALQPIIDLLSGAATNLTNAAGDPALLSAAASIIDSAVNSVIDLFEHIQTVFGPTTAPLITPVIEILNTTVTTTLQQLISCTGAAPGDCSGSNTLYHTLVNAVTTTLSGITTLVPDVTNGTTGTQVPLSELFTEALAGFDSALGGATTATGETLVESARTIETMIGLTSGNTEVFGPTGDILEVFYESAKLALACAGVNTTALNDECASFTARLHGILTDFINFLQTNIDSIPIIGPLIVNPILTALKDELIDLEQGSIMAVTGIISILDGIVGITNIVIPEGVTNPVSDYLQRINDMLRIPEGCGVEPPKCSGLIEIVRMLAMACIDLVEQIPLAGLAAKAVLPGLVNGMLDALTLGSTTAIQGAYDLLDAPVRIVEALPFVSNIAVPFRTFLDGCKAILDCLIASTPTPISIIGEIVDSVLPTGIATAAPTAAATGVVDAVVGAVGSILP